MQRFVLHTAAIMTGVLMTAGAAYCVAGYDQAQVVRTEPLYETVSYSVPQRVCHEERVERGRSGYAVAGPVLGAVIGGGIGSAFGHHHNHVSTVAGALLGAAIGHDISRRNATHDEGYLDDVTQVCRTEQAARQERRLTGYNVTYRYAGDTYTALLDHDPGRALRVRVDVAPADDSYNRDE